MVTVLPTFKTGFNEFQTQFSEGNQSTTDNPPLPKQVEQGAQTQESITPVAPEPQPVGNFSIQPSPDVTTSDLGVTKTDVLKQREVFESEATKQADLLRGEVSQTQQAILDKMQALTGKSARQRQLEIEMGVETDTAEVKRLRTEIAGIEAEMNRQLTERTGKGITARSILGEQSRIERRFLSEIGAKTALMQALQGNIELAQSTAERAVNMEFESVENELMVQLQKLEFKRGDLTKAEEKENAEQRAMIEAQQAQIEAQKEERKNIFAVALEAQKNGADPSLVASILSSGNAEEALVIGSSYVSQEKKLDLALKQQQLQTSQLQAQKILQDILNYGRLSPTEQAKVDKEERERMQSATASYLVVQDKINAVDALLASGGFAPSVGTTVVDRKATTKLGFVTKLAFFPTTKTALNDLKASVSGEQQAFAAGIKKLTAGLTLDELVSAKAQGATFGALSDTELKMLADSATLLSYWEIKDENGKGIGVYNIDEASFKKELNFIREKSQRALALSQKQAFSTDETSVLDVAFGEILSAETYY